jgi:hypothetical protein
MSPGMSGRRVSPWAAHFGQNAAGSWLDRARLFDSASGAEWCGRHHCVGDLSRGACCRERSFVVAPFKERSEIGVRLFCD